MKAIIKETGQEVEVVSRFMPKKRNAPCRAWVCVLNDERIVDEDALEYIEDKPVPEDVQEAADQYAAEQTPVEYPNLYGEDAIKTAYAAGMLAERERQEKEVAYFPEYDSIVNKVFGAGNLESWELDEAKRLVSLAKAELLKDLASCPAIKGWVARDENGQVWLYAQRPFRNHTVWTTDKGRYFIRIYDTFFPDLCWEDEPREVGIIIKTKQ